MALAIQNSPLPGLGTQADWVVMLNRYPLGETLHEQLKALIRNTLTKDITIVDNEGDSSSEQFFTLYVPEDSEDLEFTTQSGTGDIDMYVKFGARPTTTSYDCRSILSGTSQDCDIPTPSDGTYYVMLLGNTAYSGVSIEGTYTDSGGSCTSPAYVDQSTYQTNDLVQNVGNEYRCDVGGWCTIGADYEPGVGWAWQYAWSFVQSCQ